MSTFDCPISEYLGIQPAQLTYKPTVKLGFITFRLRPGETYAATNVLLTKSQLIRLRDDITSLLHDPDGWLYTPEDQWNILDVPEDLDQRLGPPPGPKKTESADKWFDLKAD